MNINEKEIWRYLGYGKEHPDEQTIRLIQECKENLLNVINPRYLYQMFSCHLTKDGWVETAGLTFQSRDLSRTLQGCEEVIFFAATLGNGVDRLMNRYSRCSISHAGVLQAVGAAAMEDYCNSCQEEIAERLKKEGTYLRPRFSPGYGDLKLELQKDFLRVIDASKNIGIFLSDGGVMIPEKSVTAFIGISREKGHCLTEGCEVCEQKNCSFRR